MRWFKHLARSRNDERLSQLIDEFGPEGYGIWWMIVERIAENMGNGDKTNMTVSVKNWSKSCRISTKKFQKTVEKLSKLGSLSAVYSGDNLTIDIPNLLKYRDEWSARSGAKRQRARDKLRSSSDTDTEKETEKDNPPYPLFGGESAKEEKKEEKSDPKKTPKKPEDEDAKFGEFWKAYPHCTSPRRSNRADTLKAWNARVKQGAVPDDMVMAAKAYRKVQVQKDRGATSFEFSMGAQRFIGPSTPFEGYVGQPEETDESSNY